MGVSKVIVNNVTKVDLTSDTVASNNLLANNTAHNKAGDAVSGGVGTGVATVSGTISSNPTISVNSSGLVTASNNKTQSFTPTITPGYITSGTAGNITVSGSNTYQLTGKAATTYTPTTTDQTISSGQFLTGTQTIKGDSNLVAANIAQGVTIFGVQGTHKGGATVIEEEDLVHGGTIVTVTDTIDLYTDTVTPARLLAGYTAHDKRGNQITGTYNPSGGLLKDDVNFYDYDGTIVASYSAEEFSLLSAMPANPSHTGLTAQGWNWSLNDAKTYVANYGKLEIGQMYVTTDGKTRLYITIDDPDFKTIRLALYIVTQVVINWGDGSSTETMGNGDYDVVFSNNHTYATTGDYVITLDVTAYPYSSYHGAHFTQELGSWSTIMPPYGYEGLSTNFIPYCRMLRKIEMGENIVIGGNAFEGYYDYYTRGYSLYSNLESITIPSETYNNVWYGYCIANCESLRHITVPASVIEVQGGAFGGCFDLKSLSLPNTVTEIGNDAFVACENLETITLPGSLTDLDNNMTFFRCHSLTTVIIPDNCQFEDLSGNYTGQTFYECGKLECFSFNSSCNTISNYCFNYCYNLKNVDLSGVIYIGEYGFSDCYSLSSITFPSSVGQIYSDALGTCSNLTEVHFQSVTPPTLNSSTILGDLPYLKRIYVPTGALSYYTSATNYPSSSYYTYIEE